MKVNDRGVKSATTGAAQVRAKELENSIKSGKSDPLSEMGETSDSSKVNVSSRAQAFQKAKAIASADSIDEAKVARLQKLIDEGKYNVDSQAVADRLVDEHLATGD